MKTAVLVLALFAAASAVPRNQQRIVGGENVPNASMYPYMTACEWRSWWTGTFSQSCGGSLLTSTAVLSAAHCYIGDAASDWRVRLGTNLRNNGGSTHNVGRLQLHPQYNDNTLVNDVAIMHLSQPATFSQNVAVARIAGPNYNLADGTPVRAIGFGTLSSGGGFPNILQHVQVNTINQNLCAERYAFLKTQPGYQNWPDITPGMLCAGILDVGGRDACQGDSGGPLAHDGNVIIGVTSWGFGCAHAFYPGVNARVSQYSNWIVANA